MGTLDLDLEVGEDERDQEEVRSDREGSRSSEALSQVLLEGGPDLRMAEAETHRLKVSHV